MLVFYVSLFLTTTQRYPAPYITVKEGGQELAAAMDGKREAASALMATLLGTVVMARMAGSRQCRQLILSAGRKAALSIVKAGDEQDRAGGGRPKRTRSGRG